MARLEIFGVVIFLAIAFNFVACSSDEIQSDIQVSIVPDMDKYLNENPDFEVQPLIKEIRENGPSQYISIAYTLGYRIPGDLVGSDSASLQWDRPNNVRSTLSYPRTGLGAVVTYIEILVDQSTNLGRAYVVSGGIGLRQIAVVVEAQSTFYFNYSASVFGY